MRDSNPRPLAPEAEDQFAVSTKIVDFQSISMVAVCEKRRKNASLGGKILDKILDKI